MHEQRGECQLTSNILFPCRIFGCDEKEHLNCTTYVFSKPGTFLLPSLSNGMRTTITITTGSTYVGVVHVSPSNWVWTTRMARAARRRELHCKAQWQSVLADQRTLPEQRGQCQRTQALRQVPPASKTVVMSKPLSLMWQILLRQSRAKEQVWTILVAQYAKPFEPTLALIQSPLTMNNVLSSGNFHLVFN